MRKFICRSPEGMKRAADVIAAMPMAKKPWLIEVKLFEEKLSDPQRGLMRRWCREVALHTGASEEGVYEFLADKFLPKIAVMLGNEERLVRKSTGKNARAAGHDEMGQFMLEIEAWAATELGLSLSREDKEEMG